MVVVLLRSLERRDGREVEIQAPAGADTAAAVEEYRKGSCGSRHCCGSGEIQIELLREQTLLRQWGNTDRAPAGADTAAAVEEYRKGSGGSRHCCGSGGI